MTEKTTPKKKEYRYPTLIRIGKEEKKLYDAEEKLHKAMIDATEALQKAYQRRGNPIEDFYKEALPQALFDLLDRFETGASVTACLAFLAMQREKGEIS